MEQNYISIAKQVKSYIQRKPYILEAIEQNIVNYSALSRIIGNDIGIKNFDTIKAAIIRYGNTNRQNRRKNQQRAIEFLRESNVSVKNKIATIHHNTSINIKSIAYSKTPSGYMFFLDENIAKKNSFNKIDYGYAILQIKSPKEIEKTPGAISFILSSLAFEGINISHVIGCREDTFIVVNEHDSALAYQIIAQRLRV